MQCPILETWTEKAVVYSAPLILWISIPQTLEIEITYSAI